jgi:hypothetical protein
VLYAAYLDPRTSRAADITVQQLRAGLSLSVRLTNTNAAVGTVAPTVTFEGGADRVLMSFKPQAVGKTVIAVVAPPTFKTPSNSTELLAIVRE